MPISVSIVAEPFNDEICLGIMKAIENKINFNVPPNLSRFN